MRGFAVGLLAASMARARVLPTNKGCTCLSSWIGCNTSQRYCAMDPPCDNDSSTVPWTTWCKVIQPCPGTTGNWDYCDPDTTPTASPVISTAAPKADGSPASAGARAPVNKDNSELEDSEEGSDSMSIAGVVGLCLFVLMLIVVGAASVCMIMRRVEGPAPRSAPSGSTGGTDEAEGTVGAVGCPEPDMGSSSAAYHPAPVEQAVEGSTQTGAAQTGAAQTGTASSTQRFTAAQLLAGGPTASVGAVAPTPACTAPAASPLGELPGCAASAMQQTSHLGAGRGTTPHQSANQRHAAVATGPPPSHQSASQLSVSQLGLCTGSGQPTSHPPMHQSVASQPTHGTAQLATSPAAPTSFLVSTATAPAATSPQRGASSPLSPYPVAPRVPAGRGVPGSPQRPDPVIVKCIASGRL